MANNSRLFSERNLQPWLIGRAEGCIKVGDGGGAGFCRFPAWARVKSNDVSPGHAPVKPVLVPEKATLALVLLCFKRDIRITAVTG